LHFSSWDSSVNKVTKLCLDNQGLNQFSATKETLPFSKVLWQAVGLTQLPIGTGGNFPRDKAAGA